MSAACDFAVSKLSVTVFLGSVERRFSAPATLRKAVARRLGQAWPQAVAAGDAWLEPGEHGGSLIEPGVRPFNAECGRTAL